MKLSYSLNQKDAFDLNGLKSFYSYVILLMKMLLTFYLVFRLAIKIQEWHQELKILIADLLGTGQQQFLYLKYMFQVKKRKMKQTSSVIT